jgi:hypothetical protein
MITGKRVFKSKFHISIVQTISENEHDLYEKTGNADFKYWIGVGACNTTGEWKAVADLFESFEKSAGDELFKVKQTMEIK